LFQRPTIEESRYRKRRRQTEYLNSIQPQLFAS